VGQACPNNKKEMAMVQRGVTVLGCLACLVFTSVQAADDLPPILVPDGFTTTVFHPGLGPARHMAVRDNGDVYVSRSQRRSMPQFNIEASNGAIIALRDTNGDGTADVVEPFGPIDVSTGLRIRDNWLYYSSNVAVYRIPDAAVARHQDLCLRQRRQPLRERRGAV
jgi:hypothetical protein